MIAHVTTRSGATVAVSVGSRISSPSMVAFLRSPVSCGPTPTLPVTFVSGLPKVTSPFASPRTANPAARPSMKPALGPQAGHPASVVVGAAVVVVVVVVVVAGGVVVGAVVGGGGVGGAG